MTQQFTASEVRTQARLLDGLSRQMLNRFADRLEADEKAVPIGWICSDDLQELNSNCGESDGVADGIEILVASHPFAMCNVPVYTHPAPSDAERLAEALRELLGDIDLVKCDFCKCHTWCSVEDSRKSLIKHEAHSAQAQRIHPDVAKAQAIPLDVNDGRPTRSAQAQPPAARVTDAMVNRLACWMIAQFGECRAPVDHKARIEWWRNQARSALEAALAAQENPNG